MNFTADQQKAISEYVNAPANSKRHKAYQAFNAVFGQTGAKIATKYNLGVEAYRFNDNQVDRN